MVEVEHVLFHRGKRCHDDRRSGRSGIVCASSIEHAHPARDVVQLARGVLKQHGVEGSRTDIFLDLDDQALAAEADTILYRPYIAEAGERGPFVDAAARASSNSIELPRPEPGAKRPCRRTQVPSAAQRRSSSTTAPTPIG